MLVPDESVSCTVEGAPSIEFRRSKQVKEFGDSAGCQCRIENILYRIYDDWESWYMFQRLWRKHDLFDIAWYESEGIETKRKQGY
jgi:hypothetical protein